MLIYSPWEIFLLSYLAGTVLTAASDCCVLSFHHESLGRIFLCLCRRVKTKIKFFPWLSSLYANQTMFFQPWASAAPSNYPSWSFSLGWTHSSFPVPFIYVGHISRCRLTGGKCSSSSTTATLPPLLHLPVLTGILLHWKLNDHQIFIIISPSFH